MPRFYILRQTMINQQLHPLHFTYSSFFNSILSLFPTIPQSVLPNRKFFLPNLTFLFYQASFILLERRSAQKIPASLKYFHFFPHFDILMLVRESFMESIKRQIKEKYHLTSYQMSLIVFLAKTLGSELSKMLIMGILFRNQLPLYFTALFIMMLLRCSTGGLHFFTYPACLLGSTIYLGLCVVVLPQLLLPKYFQLLLLAGSLLICCRIGPVTSKYRPDPLPAASKRFRDFTCLTIFFYALFLYIMPQSSFTAAGFWVIILHSLQLSAAKIRKKGGRAK